MIETKPGETTIVGEAAQKSKPGEMTTVTSVLEKLRVKKHDKEWRMSPEGFTAGTGKFYQPEDLKIIRTYRFEGESDPGDNTIVYIIEANDGLIGYSMDAYGVYSDHEDDGYDDFIRKINVEERDEQQIFQDADTIPAEGFKNTQ